MTQLKEIDNLLTNLEDEIHSDIKSRFTTLRVKLLELEIEIIQCDNCGEKVEPVTLGQMCPSCACDM